MVTGLLMLRVVILLRMVESTVWERGNARTVLVSKIGSGHGSGTRLGRVVLRRLSAAFRRCGGVRLACCGMAMIDVPMRRLCGLGWLVMLQLLLSERPCGIHRRLRMERPGSVGRLGWMGLQGRQRVLVVRMLLMALVAIGLRSWRDGRALTGLVVEGPLVVAGAPRVGIRTGR